MTRSRTLITVAVMSLSTTAFAQFWEGSSQVWEGAPSLVCHQRYDLEAGGRTIGHMVAVSPTCTSQPEGFDPGREHWSWVGAAWPSQFNMHLVRQGPAFSGLTWQEYPLDMFDLTHSEPMPPVTVGVDDRFYEVYEGSGASSTHLTHVAWMHLLGAEHPRQHWYGIDGALTHPLVGVGANVIRLRSASPPAANSVDVHIIDSIIDHGEEVGVVR